MNRIIFLLVICAFGSTQAAKEPDMPKILDDVLGVSSTENEKMAIDKITADLGLNSESGSEIRFLLKPVRSALLSANSEGSIGKLALVAGKSFKKGDVLVKISCNLQEAELAHSKAERAAAKYIYQTNKLLRKSRSVGKLALYQSEQEYEKMRAGVKSAQSKVSDCVTIAPYSGKVAKVYNKQYQYVNAGQELVEIFDDKVFEMKMLVPSSWLSWLKKGYVFEARLDETNAVFKAKIKRISPKIDSVSKTVPVSATLISEPDLRLYGMSGVAYFKPKELIQGK